MGVDGGMGECGHRAALSLGHIGMQHGEGAHGHLIEQPALVQKGGEVGISSSAVTMARGTRLAVSTRRPTARDIAEGAVQRHRIGIDQKLSGIEPEAALRRGRSRPRGSHRRCPGCLRPEPPDMIGAALHRQRVSCPSSNWQSSTRYGMARDHGEKAVPSAAGWAPSGLSVIGCSKGRGGGGGWFARGRAARHRLCRPGLDAFVLSRPAAFLCGSRRAAIQWRETANRGGDGPCPTASP